MAAWVPAAIGAGASLLGGIFGGNSAAAGARAANEANLKIARENREFQERMSNTAVQRRMQDMKKAGINPILAARYDATTPAGNVAQMENVGLARASGFSQTASAVSGAISTGRAMATLDSEIKLVQARTGLSEAQTNVLATLGELSQKGKEVLQGIWAAIEQTDSSIIDMILDDVTQEVKDIAKQISELLMDSVQNGIDTVSETVENLVIQLSNMLSLGIER